MAENVAELLRLAERVEGLTVPFHDELLDIKVAEALGWHIRRVTSLGLNGRTPGSWLWFGPDPSDWSAKGSRKPPRMSGPKRRRQTAAALRARAATLTNDGEDNG